MGHTTVILLLLVFAVLAVAKEFVLEDLIAEEDTPDNRRVIHNIGDDMDQSRSRKFVRQSRVEDTIRTVQEPITGPGSKHTSDKTSTVKDKGGGSKQDDDDDKKTLSQQVADGKYGLIQTEIFTNNPKRPGIISYEVNPEVPKDNINNLGGLKPEEIWLAENHVLVLSGGGFKGEDNIAEQLWPPIDNYIAPPRQVKIPPNPKVPPPFPVQLRPGGPLEFIKNENGTGGPPPFFPPFNGQFPISPNASFPYPPANYLPGNFTPGNGPYPPPPFPFFPPQNGTFFPPPGFPPPGFLPPIPPGAAFLPPPGNLTDQFDEDDPSIYYPPPYDFYYPKDNSSLVPAGPLVPGIVLPPPPDFFAPYKNTTTSKARRPVSNLNSKKIPSRKPTKHKNVQIVTSTEDPYDGVNIRPNIGKVNIITSTPPPYTTSKPSLVTGTHTRRPQFETTTSKPFDDVTPQTIIHDLPPNAVVKGWVPIPAPRPYYITGQRKPLHKGTTTLPPDYNSITPPNNNGYFYKTPDYELSVNSWLYSNRTKNYPQHQQYYKVFTESPKHDYYYDELYSDKGQYYSSTESPLGFDDESKLKSLYYPTQSPATSTVEPAQVYQSQVNNRGKSLKTFYFYEEPHISEGKLTDAESLPFPQGFSQQQFRTGDPHTITEEVYINSAAKQSTQQFKPSPLDYFFPQDDYYNLNSHKSSTESPLSYFHEQPSSKGYGDYPYPQAPAVVNSPRTKTTTKPPVYEYSFSIPGYGSSDPPKVGLGKTQEYLNPYNNQQTTPRPFDLYTTPTPTTTPTPVYKSQNQGESHYYRTQRPRNQYYPTPRPQVKDTIQTENPYHAFFTHHDADLIDDITKKYFTTFGQKLNKDSIGGDTLTTPLPPVDSAPENSYYPHTSPKPQYYETDRPKVKFQQSSIPLTSQGYQEPDTSLVKNYPQRHQYSRPVYSQFYNQPHPSLGSTQKPISLESDILVNYKEPLPPINPAAEIIDPSTVGGNKPEQSFISYRLPGNGGGHFFFLTPQVVQQNRQYSDYVYSDGDNRGIYFKRNARQPQSQRSTQETSRTL